MLIRIGRIRITGKSIIGNLFVIGLIIGFGSVYAQQGVEQGIQSDTSLLSRRMAARLKRATRSISKPITFASQGHRLASTFISSPETGTGFGKSDYLFWKFGVDIKSISAEPGGLVYGLFDNTPGRFNTLTYSLNQVSNPLNINDINSKVVRINGNKELVVVGTFIDSTKPTWIQRYDVSSLNYISSVTVSAVANQIRLPEALSFSTDNDIFVSGENLDLNNYTTSPWLWKYSENLSFEKEFTFDYNGGISDSVYASDGFLYATGWVDNLVNDNHVYAWIGKFDKDLNLIKEKRYAVNEGCFSNAIDVSSDGFVYLAGYQDNTTTETAWIARFTNNLDFLSQFTAPNPPENHYSIYWDITAVGASVYVVGEYGSNGGDYETEMTMGSFSKSLALKSTHQVGEKDGLFDGSFSITNDDQGNILIGGFVGASGVQNYDDSGIGWLSFHPFDLTSPQSGEKPQPYPNPFRASLGHTRMSIGNLPPDSILKLYTLKGELVREIPTQSGEILWDVKNSSGELVRSGVFFGLVEGQGNDKTFKVVVQR